MEKDQICLDCLNCKLISKWGELTCKSGHWTKIDGTLKHIILQSYEKKTLDIKPRDIFHKARKCDDMIYMD